MTDENQQLLTAAITDRGLSEKRPQNEDSYLSLPEHGIFAVADGVGGAMAGDVASQMAVEILGEAFVNYSGTVAPEEIMTVAIDRANLAINQMASELPQLSSMATTIVALHLAGNTATIAHVGDSRLYRLDVEGNLYRETADHSVVEEEVRAGRMTPEQAATHPSRNVISRAVGAELSVDIDLRTITVEPGTSFLLCSDGITRHIADHELGELLTTGMSVEMLCEQMKEMCYNRGAEDNLTAIIVKLLAVEKPVIEASHPIPEEAPAVAEALEEETIATARSPFEDYAEMPTVETEIEQPPTSVSTESDFALTENVEPPPANDVQEVSEALSDLDDEAYLMEDETESPVEPFAEPVEEPEVSSEYTSSRVIVPATSVAAEPAPEREFSMFGETPKAKVMSEASSSNNSSSVLRSLIYLLLGAALGATGLYFWMQPGTLQPETQVIPVQDLAPKTDNVPASTLEELRWNVDRDPDAYVQASVASAKDAEDHYILGRALFLSGKHFEAKRQFTLALEKLSNADPKSAATIRAEIAMMNAIIGDAQAADAFKRSFEEAQKQNSTVSSSADPNTAPASSGASNTNPVP